MATEGKYAVVAGVVQQFGDDDDAVKEKEVAGKDVREVVVRAVGTQKLVRVTVWPDEHEDVPLGKGFYIVAEGKFTQNESNGTTYYNLSAVTLHSFAPCGTSSPKKGKKAAAAEATGDDDAPF